MITVDTVIALPSISPYQGLLHHLVTPAKDLRITLPFSSAYPTWTTAILSPGFSAPFTPFQITSLPAQV